MRSIKTKEVNKFGKVIVIETSKATGSTVIGLKFNENVDNVLNQLLGNYKDYLETPVLGVDLSTCSTANATEQKTNESMPSKTDPIIKNDIQAGGGINNIQSGNNNNPIRQNSTQITSSKSNQSSSITGFATSIQHNQKMNEFNKLLNAKDDVEIIETNYFNEQSSMCNYIINNQDKKNAFTDIVYSVELGLAIERLPDNVTLDSLWKIILN